MDVYRTEVRGFVDAAWERDVLPVLSEYLLIPARSPAYDAEWAAAGHLDRAVDLLADWCRGALAAVPGVAVDVVRLPGLTPTLVVEVPASGGAGAGAGRGPDAHAGTVLVYGHYDKQPEMVGWRDGLGPWTPVREGDRLYGRGGADDGYSVFAAVTALLALREQGAPHARCLIVVEGSEESGSPDLPAYVEALAARLGPVELVVCLDSGGPTWDRLWTTTSLRGLVNARLAVATQREGVHSGTYGGLGPSTFRILRHLLDRIEDPVTGAVLLAEAAVAVPPEHEAAARQVGALLGDGLAAMVPFLDGVQPVSTDPGELTLNRTWRPTLEITGIDGVPPIAGAGNVLRPATAVKLSLRLPPTASADVAGEALRRRLAADPPYGAHVDVEILEGGSGWAAPPTAPWLARALEDASRSYWGAPAGSTGEGGSIPFMGLLGQRFPAAQFCVLGVLGPGSNAHGPNEFLDLPTARNVTATVATVVTRHAAAREDAP
jgi:acetylornithine deacetylase/succinyl-diaminopimelate desuccinylase-like protein